MRSLLVRTLCVFCTALAFGGASCGLRTTLEPDPSTGTEGSGGSRAGTLNGDAGPGATGGSAGPSATPDAAQFVTPDAVSSATGTGGAQGQQPDAAPVRNPDAFVQPFRPDAGFVFPFGDGGTSRTRDGGGFLAPDFGRGNNRDGGFTFPGFGNDGGFTFPTRPDAGFTFPGFGNDGGFTFPGFGNDGGFTFPTRPDAGFGRAREAGAGFGGGRTGGSRGTTTGG